MKEKAKQMQKKKTRSKRNEEEKKTNSFLSIYTYREIRVERNESK